MPPKSIDNTKATAGARCIAAPPNDFQSGRLVARPILISDHGCRHASIFLWMPGFGGGNRSKRVPVSAPPVARRADMGLPPEGGEILEGTQFGGIFMKAKLIACFAASHELATATQAAVQHELWPRVTRPAHRN